MLKELSKVRIPNRLYTFSIRIWLPRNWVTLKTIEGDESVIPTVMGDKQKQAPYGSRTVSFYAPNFERVVNA